MGVTDFVLEKKMLGKAPYVRKYWVSFLNKAIVSVSPKILQLDLLLK